LPLDQNRHSGEAGIQFFQDFLDVGSSPA